ncbi:MAG: CHAD domain-containing protein [Verrucomicrobiota bacterium]
MASRNYDAPMQSLIAVWDDMAQEDTGLLSGRSASPADVHRLRLAAKQLRAHLRLIRTGVSPDWFKSEDLALRDAGKQLGALRDNHVVIKSLVALPKALSSPSLWQAVRETVEALNVTPPSPTPQPKPDPYEQSGVAVPEVAAALRSHTHEMIHTVRPSSGWTLINQGLRQTYKKSRQRHDSWRKTDDPACAHRLRRQVKYLAFQTGFLAPFSKKNTEKQTARLHELERTLGKLNDLCTVESRLASVEADGNVAPENLRLIRKALRSKRRRHHQRASNLAKKLFANSPKAFLKNVQA